jgi:hypothetical protein
MREIFALLQQAGPSKACVLITGESGTGKELVARTCTRSEPAAAGSVYRHQLRGAAGNADRERIVRAREGILHGASERRPGCFELAQHGTLLLDEIGEMPLPTQAKLLRILEDSQGAAAGRQDGIRSGRARGGGHQQGAGRSHPRRPSARRPVLPAERFSYSSAAACASARRMSPISEALIAGLNRKHECRVTGISPDVLERSSGTPGRAMCANCAMCWSAR